MFKNPLKLIKLNKNRINNDSIEIESKVGCWKSSKLNIFLDDFSIFLNKF